MSSSFTNDNTNQGTNSGIVIQLINRTEELYQAVSPSDSIRNNNNASFYQCCQIKFLNIHENFSEMFTKSSCIEN